MEKGQSGSKLGKHLQPTAFRFKIYVKYMAVRASQDFGL